MFRKCMACIRFVSFVNFLIRDSSACVCVCVSPQRTRFTISSHRLSAHACKRVPLYLLLLRTNTDLFLFRTYDILFTTILLLFSRSFAFCAPSIPILLYACVDFFAVFFLFILLDDCVIYFFCSNRFFSIFFSLFIIIVYLYAHCTE